MFYAYKYVLTHCDEDIINNYLKSGNIQKVAGGGGLRMIPSGMVNISPLEKMQTR